MEVYFRRTGHWGYTSGSENGQFYEIQAAWLSLAFGGVLTRWQDDLGLRKRKMWFAVLNLTP